MYVFRYLNVTFWKTNNNDGKSKTTRDVYDTDPNPRFFKQYVKDVTCVGLILFRKNSKEKLGRERNFCSCELKRSIQKNCTVLSYCFKFKTGVRDFRFYPIPQVSTRWKGATIIKTHDYMKDTNVSVLSLFTYRLVEHFWVSGRVIKYE